MNVLVAHVEDTFSVQKLLSYYSEAVDVALLSSIERIDARVIDLELWGLPELFLTKSSTSSAV